MSTYTIRIKELIDNGYELFDFEYPIFCPCYKPVLEEKIINRYYFREIGFETPDVFKHYLKTRLNEIMPYYNQLYESERLEFDPMINVDVTETYKNESTSENTATGESSGTTSGTNSNHEVFQDTPQSKIGNVEYATNITDNENNGESNSTNTASNTSNSTAMAEYERHRFGTEGMRYPASVLMEWRKSFLNIDKEILDNLNDLFMGVY